jgi:hypothetical protein
MVVAEANEEAPFIDAEGVDWELKLGRFVDLLLLVVRVKV